MSHAETSIQPVLLNPGGAANDTPADEVRTFWTAGDDDCSVTLSDGSVVISTRTAPDVASSIRSEIQTRLANGDTPVLASHMDALGLRAAVEEWAAGS